MTRRTRAEGLFLIIPERIFEDHECLVELLSIWGRHSNNSIYFLSNPQKYEMFRNPEVSSFSLESVCTGHRLN